MLISNRTAHKRLAQEFRGCHLAVTFAPTRRNHQRARGGIVKTFVATLALLTACSMGTNPGVQARDAGEQNIRLVGSSTLYPLTKAVASELTQGDAQVLISVTGTTKGIKEFCSGRAAVAAASREMNPEERQTCSSSGIDIVSIPLGYDAISIVVHPNNSWVTHLTLDELRRIWAPEAQGRIVTWDQIRPDFPNRRIALYGPGKSSGTFDSFSERIVGERGALRGDYQSSEDDHLLVHELANDEGSLGFIGLSYAIQNPSTLRVVGIGSDAATAVVPSVQSVQAGRYQQLARLTYLYATVNGAASEHQRRFLRQYLNFASTRGEKMGFVPLNRAKLSESFSRLQEVKP